MRVCVCEEAGRESAAAAPGTVRAYTKRKRATLPNFMSTKKIKAAAKKTACVSFFFVAFVVVFWVKGKINMRLRLHLNKNREAIQERAAAGGKRQMPEAQVGSREA